MSLDWDIAGTWAGAIATAGAVYFAATLAERSRVKDRFQMRKERYAALVAIYHEAEQLIGELSDSTFEGEAGPEPPPVDQFTDLLDALSTVPVLELGNYAAISTLFQVKRALIKTRDMRREFGTPDWMGEYVNMCCSTYGASFAKYISAARSAAKFGVWPHE